MRLTALDRRVKGVHILSPQMRSDVDACIASNTPQQQPEWCAERVHVPNLQMRSTVDACIASTTQQQQLEWCAECVPVTSSRCTPLWARTASLAWVVALGRHQKRFLAEHLQL